MIGGPGAAASSSQSATKQIQKSAAEYQTVVHFQKCYGVLKELFEEFDGFKDLSEGFRFLDLGCAPGGFSAFLLEDPRCGAGFGVSLPASSGGFPMRIKSESFFVQHGDLFEIRPGDLTASEVDVCICDAQYLRNTVAWEERYRGVRCRSRQHGVWALLCKQLWLGLSKLQQRGIMVFRFGWRDGGPDDEPTTWYRKNTLRLFSIMLDLFETVKEVKSKYFNANDSSFYVACVNFRADRFVERGSAKMFSSTFNYIMRSTVDEPMELDVLRSADQLSGVRSPEIDAKINEMLDRIDKLRIIHHESKKWHTQQDQKKVDPEAWVFLCPLPVDMTPSQLEKKLKVYGWVQELDVNKEADRVGIRFANSKQAEEACAALRVNSSSLGEGIRVWLRKEETAMQQKDQWQNDQWAYAPSSYPMATSEYAATDYAAPEYAAPEYAAHEYTEPDYSMVMQSNGDGWGQPQGYIGEYMQNGHYMQNGAENWYEEQYAGGYAAVGGYAQPHAANGQYAQKEMKGKGGFKGAFAHVG